MTSTTIKIGAATRERLKGFGRKGETYDDLLNRIMDLVEEHFAEWSEAARPPLQEV